MYLVPLLVGTAFLGNCVKRCATKFQEKRRLDYVCRLRMDGRAPR